MDGSVSLISIVLRPREIIAPLFCNWLLKSGNFQEEFYRWGRGIVADLWTTKFSEMKRITIALPMAPEQQAIAAFLDHETGKIDGLVEEQRRLIALLREKRQAVISHAVTKGLDPNAPMKDSGVEWLGEVPEHWEIASLKYRWTVTDCKHVTAEFIDDGIPVASIREVQARYVDLNQAKRTTIEDYQALTQGGRKPEPGDLIFSRNATVGEVAQVCDWHPEFAMGQDVCVLRRTDRGQSPDFMQACLKSSAIQRQLDSIMVGATFRRVNVEDIRCMSVTFPPALEQERIGQFIIAEDTKFAVLISESEAAITLLQERRSALISAAVTGKIDVRDWSETATEAA